MRHSCKLPLTGTVIYFSMVLMGSAAPTITPVAWVIRARYVVTMDGEHRIIPNGAVAIEGPNIVAVGTQGKVALRYRAKQNLDKPEAIVMPGIIDKHTHAPMSLFRGIATICAWKTGCTTSFFQQRPKMGRRNLCGGARAWPAVRHYDLHGCAES